MGGPALSHVAKRKMLLSCTYFTYICLLIKNRIQNNKHLEVENIIQTLFPEKLWPACRDLSLIDKVWRTMKWKIRQQRPQTAAVFNLAGIDKYSTSILSSQMIKRGIKAEMM